MSTPVLTAIDAGIVVCTAEVVVWKKTPCQIPGQNSFIGIIASLRCFKEKVDTRRVEAGCWNRHAARLTSQASSPVTRIP